MMQVHFEIGGKRVRPENLGNELEKAILKQVRDRVVKVLEEVRCPEHGSSASVTCKGKSVDELTFEIKGCCDKLVSAVTAKLAE